MTPGVRSVSIRRIIFGGLVIVLELTGMSLVVARPYGWPTHKWPTHNPTHKWWPTHKPTHKWWPTLKSVVFGSGSSLPPLVRGGGGGGTVCESVGKLDLLFSHFYSKHAAQDPVVLPSTLDPSSSLTIYICLKVEGGNTNHQSKKQQHQSLNLRQ